MPLYRLRKGTIQYGFNKSRAKMQVFGGGFGNGKTTALVIKALQLALDYPGSNGLLARATYPKLNDTVRKEFLKWCPSEFIKRRPTVEDNTAILTNGSVVNFRYIAQRGKQREDGSTSSNLLSATYDWIGVDQIEDPEIAHKDLLDLLGRLRGQTPYRASGDEDPSLPSSGPRFIMLTSNPSPNWFFREVVQPYQIWKRSGIKTEKLIVDVDTGLPIMELFEGSTYTNEENLPRDFIKGLEAAYKGQMRDRFLLGQWAAYEGLVHPGFDRQKHFMQYEVLMEYLERLKMRHVQVKALECFDFGLTSPSAYLYGFINDFGQVFFIDGFYEPDYDYRQQAAHIKKIRAKYAHYITREDDIYSDPALFKRIMVAGRKNTGETVAKLFEEEGIDLIPASNHILPGITKVNAYLNGYPGFTRIDNKPSADEEGAPLLYFNENLLFIEEEITAYYWKKHTISGKNLDEPMDTNDHAMNALKYGLAHRPMPSAIVQPKDKLPPAWMYWREQSNDEELAERYE
jgi:hypothetical protein